MNLIGRPKYSAEQYNAWLDDLKPFLKQGRSLRNAIECAGLFQHKDTLYRKFRENDWFCDKVKAFQSYPGELANIILVKEVEKMHTKVILGHSLDAIETRILTFMATHHRSCQPFFVTRVEASSKRGPLDEQKIGKIIESLDTQ